MGIPEIVTTYESRNEKVAPWLDQLAKLEDSRTVGAPLTDEEKVLLHNIKHEDEKLPNIEQLEVINSEVSDKVLTCIQNGVLSRV